MSWNTALGTNPANCSSTFRGNLSITLESTVTINFTSSQLLLNGDPYLDSAGMVRRNSSVTNVPMVIMYAGDTNMPRLGGMFFNPAYLMVNHDKNEFSIASAQTPPAQPDIVGIDTAHDCVAWLNGTVLLSTSPTPGQNVSTPDSDKLSSKLSSGTIASISVGVVAGIILIIVAAYLFWRRRRGNTAEVLEPGSANKAVVAEKDVAEVFEAGAGAHVHEAGFDIRQSAAELDGRTRPTELY